MIQKTPKAARRPPRVEAGQVFRQFAWNLAGTLATPPPPAPRPPEKG